MKTILFVDPTCPNPYNKETLEKGVLGGTEATALRVVLQLQEKYTVHLAQRVKGKEDTYHIENVNYNELKPDVVVTLRDAQVLRKQIGRFPNSKHFLWLHDMVGGLYRDHLLEALRGLELTIICVSDFHRNHVIQALMPILGESKLSIKTIYNPLGDDVINKRIRHNPKKLVFFSSPHKGLDYTLKVFEVIRRRDPDMKLYVANPGYFEDPKINMDNVVFLGKLMHKEVLKHVEESLCTFYPQISFEETFGLVYAESNGVGTPILCHPFGAACEVLENPSQFVDCRHLESIVKTVLEWSNGKRPVVYRNKMFDIKRIGKEWEKLFI